ncbi:MAG: 4Fe-4S dicluster domain-containing protein [Planctomycetota bacterium]|nr:MAG: 4Fe-4S dicluster domain-containing protein [Planctomycetota bacterium]
MTRGLLIDLARCRGCGSCVTACREINRLPLDAPAERLDARTWTFLDHRAGLTVKRQCMHCLDPACASVCPVGAMHRSPDGPVVYDETLCMGCRYCMIACPFGVPRYEWDSREPRVRKCILCWEQRVRNGEKPACAAVCPAGAIAFGERQDLVDRARQRLRERPDDYVDHIYGLREAGGTSVLYLSPVPFAALGFPRVQEDRRYPGMTWAILEKMPAGWTVSGALLVGLWWLTGRREVMARVERGELSVDEAMQLAPPLAGGAGREEE